MLVLKSTGGPYAGLGLVLTNVWVPEVEDATHPQSEVSKVQARADTSFFIPAVGTRKHDNNMINDSCILVRSEISLSRLLMPTICGTKILLAGFRMGAPLKLVQVQTCPGVLAEKVNGISYRT